MIVESVIFSSVIMSMGKDSMGMWVFGSHGNLHTPPDNPGEYTRKEKIKHRMRLFGQVVFYVASNTWGVL